MSSTPIAEHSDQTVAAARRLPPVSALAIASMGLVIAAGIYLAAHLPSIPPMAPAAGLIAGAGALLFVDLLFLARIKPFAWSVFFQVSGWALVAYGAIGGVLAYVFLFDHTRGSALVAVILSLVLFALDVPLLLGFSVARHQEPPR
jgi:hypothetical protein